jgi:hypothetical protein
MHRPSPALEPAMKIRPIERAVSLVLAFVITIGMLGGIDQLAGQQEASPLWAAAVMARGA